MSKAVLISIQPKWCELIANGQKTIEVRRTRPKIDTPFKCYIYCTHPVGKVIGEFVCDYIDDCVFDTKFTGTYRLPVESCLDNFESLHYGKGKLLYCWNISGLVIYDTPKVIRNFRSWKTEHQIVKAYYQEGACDVVEHVRVLKPIERPPQSWCFVDSYVDT